LNAGILAAHLKRYANAWKSVSFMSSIKSQSHIGRRS
jgi:hypothetical protein